MPIRSLLLAILLAPAFLPAAGALVASADDGPARGPDAPVRPPATVLRATEAAPRELVVFIGGLGSQASDRTFDELAGRLAAGPRFELRRFGADPAHPYDTSGALDPSADALAAEVRERAPSFAAVHLVTHSMGGAVVDRALDRGLSSADGIRTIVSLAPPRTGSLAARTATGLLELAGEDAAPVHSILGVVQEPDSPAIRDLARRRAPAPAPGITRLDLRLASDALVLPRDARAPGTDARTLLPSTPSALEGHGGILRDPRALDLAAATISSGRAPADERTLVERRLTDAAAALDGRLVTVALVVVSLLLVATICALRFRRLCLSALRAPLGPRTPAP